MRVQWFGQSTFSFAAGDLSVFVDPFAEMPAERFGYPSFTATADLLLVTHEHLDHNGVERITGEPVVIRSTAGTFKTTPAGAVVGIASEHDELAGTARGANVIYVFDIGGARVVHFGDFGQAALRPEQRAAIGERVDLLIVPVGGGPTVGAAGAKALVDELAPRWVLPMHYRTHRITFLDTADEFIAAFDHVERVDSSFSTTELPEIDGPLLIVPAAP